MAEASTVPTTRSSVGTDSCVALATETGTMGMAICALAGWAVLQALSNSRDWANSTIVVMRFTAGTMGYSRKKTLPGGTFAYCSHFNREPPAAAEPLSAIDSRNHKTVGEESGKAAEMWRSGRSRTRLPASDLHPGIRPGDHPWQERFRCVRIERRDPHGIAVETASGTRNGGGLKGPATGLARAGGFHGNGVGAGQLAVGVESAHVEFDGDLIRGQRAELKARPHVEMAAHRKVGLRQGIHRFDTNFLPMSLHVESPGRQDPGPSRLIRRQLLV